MKQLQYIAGLNMSIDVLQEIRSGIFNTEYSNISKSRKKEKTLGLYRGFSFCSSGPMDTLNLVNFVTCAMIYYK